MSKWQGGKSPNTSNIKHSSAYKRTATPEKSDMLNSKVLPNPGVVTDADGNEIQIYRPTKDPAFFNILIERRHAERLEHKDLDHESRLEVVYRILKEELRRAKKDLLGIKKNKEIKKRHAIELKKKIAEANAKEGKDSIKGQVIELINLEGEPIGTRKKPTTTV
jgi:hypothetical protein